MHASEKKTTSLIWLFIAKRNIFLLLNITDKCQAYVVSRIIFVAIYTMYAYVKSSLIVEVISVISSIQYTLLENNCL